MVITEQTVHTAWQHYWIGLFGPTSRLKPPPLSSDVTALLRNGGPAQPHKAHNVRPGVRKVRSQTARKSKEERATARVERDIKAASNLPLSDWARALIDAPGVSAITLGDILDGIEDYFEIFANLRQVSREGYAYFSRAGAPIIFNNTQVRLSDIEAPTFTQAPKLPSYFGAFFTRTKEAYREEIINEKPAFLEFQFFEKLKNAPTYAPLDTTIFRQNEIALKRNAFSKEELKKYPFANKNYGAAWYTGVLPDGTIKALPAHMCRSQKLPSGDRVHHSAFQIPPGLYQLSKHKDAHEFVRIMFNIIVHFTAAAMSGISVIITRGGLTARFGIPLTRAKEFFADRDDRRKILHLTRPHERVRNGKSIHVGEHLRGNRSFSWRGYDVTISVPGIHHPSPEGFNSPLWDTDEPHPTDKDLCPISDAANLFLREVKKQTRVPFRKGLPTITRAPSTLPVIT